MDIAGKLTTKGQVTVPKAVRDALGLRAGDQIVFRVRGGDHAELSRTGDFLSLAGSVSVPAARRGTPWDEVRRTTRAARATARR